MDKRSMRPKMPGTVRRYIHLLMVISVLMVFLMVSGCGGGGGGGTKPVQTTYTNPVARYAAGMIFKAPNGYYYNYTLGSNHSFDVWYSKDMVNWQKSGKAFDPNNQTLKFGALDFWAPSILYQNGKYYLFYAAREDSGPNAGYQSICLAVSGSPTGPFINVKAPLLQELHKDCLDPFVFRDDDGKLYLFYARGWKNNNVYHELVDRTYRTSQIWVREISDDLMTLGEPHFVTQPEDLWEFDSAYDNGKKEWRPDGNGTIWNEACNVFKHNGKYYVTYSANHVEGPEYAIGYAVADNIFGPYVKGKNNPIIKTDLSLKISGPGHSSITTSPDGTEMFICYHSTDPDNKDKGREYNIDRIHFEEDGTLVVDGPTRDPQPMPSK